MRRIFGFVVVLALGSVPVFLAAAAPDPPASANPPVQNPSNSKTEARGPGLCAVCTETSSTARLDEVTNADDVGSLLNVGPEKPAAAPPARGSKGDK